MALVLGEIGGLAPGDVMLLRGPNLGRGARGARRSGAPHRRVARRGRGQTVLLFISRGTRTARCWSSAARRCPSASCAAACARAAPMCVWQSSTAAAAARCWHSRVERWVSRSTSAWRTISAAPARRSLRRAPPMKRRWNRRRSGRHSSRTTSSRACAAQRICPATGWSRLRKLISMRSRARCAPRPTPSSGRNTPRTIITSPAAASWSHRAAPSFGGAGSADRLRSPAAGRDRARTGGGRDRTALGASDRGRSGRISVARLA